LDGVALRRDDLLTRRVRSTATHVYAQCEWRGLKRRCGAISKWHPALSARWRAAECLIAEPMGRVGRRRCHRSSASIV